MTAGDRPVGHASVDEILEDVEHALRRIEDGILKRWGIEAIVGGVEIDVTIYAAEVEPEPEESKHGPDRNYPLDEVVDLPPPRG